MNEIKSSKTSVAQDKERVIQPTDSFVREIEAQKQQEESRDIAVDEVHESSSVDFTYPESITSIDQPVRTPSQEFAVALNDSYSSEINRPVSMRVKSLLMVAVVSVLEAIYTIWISFSFTEGSTGVIILVLGIIQLGMAGYLCIGKDHNTTAVILKIYLILYVVSTVSSLANPTVLIFRIIVFVFLFYVYSRVKSLSY